MIFKLIILLGFLVFVIGLFKLVQFLFKKINKMEIDEKFEEISTKAKTIDKIKDFKKENKKNIKKYLNDSVDDFLKE